MKSHYFHVLLSLADDDRHGSGIMREVLDMTGGEVRLWPVRLYSTLDELSNRGWIEELRGPDAHPAGKSRRRRYYRITRRGRAALGAEADRLGRLVALVRDRNEASRRHPAAER